MRQPPQTDASDSQIRAVMLPMMLVLFMSTLDQTVVVTALGRIGAALGNAQAAPWITTAYLLTSAVMTLIFGKLGDLYGRKPMLLLAIAIFTLGSVLCALAPSMWWLAAARAFQGVGGGGLSALVMALVGDLVPARDRAKHQGVLGIVPAVALVGGPIVGGLIVDHVSWQSIFLINAPVGVVAGWMIATRLQLATPSVPRSLDIAGAVLAVVFTSALLLAAVLGGRTFPWASWPILGLAAAGNVALVVYLLVERSAAEPLTPPRLFADGVFSISAALFFISTALLFVGMVFVPLMMASAFHLSAFEAGACIVPLLIGLIGATIVTGAVITRTGRYKRFPIMGALLAGAALIGLGLTSTATPLALLLLDLTALGAGVGLFIQVTLLAGQNAVAPRDLGVATGALNFFKSLGGAAGAAVFGAVLSSATPAIAALTPAHILAGFHAVFWWTLPLAVLALGLAVLLEERPLSCTVMEIVEGRLDVPEY